MVIFFSLCYFIVSKIFLGFTQLSIMSINIDFSLHVNLPAYGWPTNVFANSWLWDPQINFNIHPSPLFAGYPRNLKGQPYFLVLLSVTCKSFLYRLYLPPRWLVEVSNLNITITKPKWNTTFLAHFRSSSRVRNTYKSYHNKLFHLLINKQLKHTLQT